jgi:hypothetical protein
MALPRQLSLRPRLAVAVAVVGLALAGTGCALSDGVEVLSSAGALSGCFTTRAGGLGVEILPVDLAAETLGAPLGTIASPDVSSLGAIDGTLVTCTHEGGIEIIDLTTRKTERIQRACDGVTSDGTLVWVNSVLESSLFEYQGLQALRDHDVKRRFSSVHATRLGVGEGRLLAAWHSAAEVLAIDLDTGAATPIPLPGYDGWIFGLAERGDQRFVLGGWVERGIRVYDRTSGALTDTLFPNQFLQGLTCPE